MKVGSLVECVVQMYCIDKTFNAIIPVKGKIYTVRDIRTFNGKDGIVLEEIVNTVYDFKITGREEPYFDIHSFREVLPPINITEVIEKEMQLEIKL